MSTEELKPGDKVMFLGVYTNDPDHKKWAEVAKLVPLKVYTIASMDQTSDFNLFVQLKGVSFWHYHKYFQKVE